MPRHDSPLQPLPPCVTAPASWHRLQAIDWSLLGAPQLYLAMNDGASRDFGPQGLLLAADDWVGSGTLRNSLFIAPWVELTRARGLALVVDAVGHFRLRVMRAAPGQPAEIVREVHLQSAQRSQQVLSLGSLSALPANSRLFWHLDALDDGRLYQASWCTREAPKADMRLAVLMRTWGRTADLQAQLRRFAEGLRGDAFHAEVLARTDFWVLDATAQAAELWRDAEELGLSLEVLQGPNLGGGGNASHLMTLFLDACDQAPESAPSDVLMLDDDAIVSMESLARHFMHCAYREGEHISTLPVLMRSQPTQVWEDGGFWGRLNFQVQGEFGRRRNLFPHLLKHGLSMAGFEHLDQFGPLNRCEYATFIFFGLPLATLRRIGLPAAFFLRGDDIEYSLRAQGLGVAVISNPNLAAWHEPGHSYPQEYMAILHAVLINLQHSDTGAAELACWFEQRFAEHAALGDLDGMRLYLGIVESLLDSDSCLLSSRFAQHYAQRLPALAALPCSRLPEAERTRVEADARAHGTLLLPFLYPGFHPDAGRYRAVVLHNSSAGSYRELPPCAPLDRLALHREALSRLDALVRSFEALRAFWCGRLAASGTREFWAQVRDEQAGWTQPLLSSPYQRPAPDVAPLAAQADAAPDVASALHRLPVHELRRRIEDQLTDLSRLRRETRHPASRSAALAEARRPAWRRWLGRWWPGRAASTGAAKAAATNTPLPSDFDPAQYLALNADVARTGMDARQHYLRFGRQEGRRYRN